MLRHVKLRRAECDQACDGKAPDRSFEPPSERRRQEQDQDTEEGGDIVERRQRLRSKQAVPEIGGELKRKRNGGRMEPGNFLWTAIY